MGSGYRALPCRLGSGHHTFPIRLHSRGGVDCVPKETVTGHLQPYHTGTHRSWRGGSPSARGGTVLTEAGGRMEGGRRAGLGPSRRGGRWDLRPVGGTEPPPLSSSLPEPLPAPSAPHLCGCQRAGAAAPAAGGGCGTSAPRPAAPGPCGPPRGRAAARSARGAPTPPCRRRRSSPPARAARAGTLCSLYRPQHLCTVILSPTHLPLSLLTSHPLRGFSACSVSLDTVSVPVPWSPFLKILCHSALHLCLTLSWSLSVSFHPHSHPHLVHVEKTNNLI